MKEVKNNFIKKYEYEYLGQLYEIYIKETKNSYETYIQNFRNGILMLMFGLPKNIDEDTLYDIIYFNLDKYIHTYNEEYGY